MKLFYCMQSSKMLSRSVLRSKTKEYVRVLSTLPEFKYNIDRLYDTNYLNIPKLPVPEVANTMECYLRSVQPLATPAEFENTRKLAADFQAQLAPKLQAEVLKLYESKAYPYSYVEKYWDMMYQGGRWPVMVNSNPFYVFEDDTPEDHHQTTRAAKLSSRLLRWWIKVISGQLEADMEGDKPLCMYGFGYVFGTYRIPRIGRDNVVSNYFSRHIVVICNHQYFTVNVIDDKQQAISPEKLKLILDDIQAKASAKTMNPDEDVGVLTSAERDFFAKARDELVKDPINQESMHALNTCLFTICLDDTECTTDLSKSQTMLTGVDGTNRWFDKHCVIATRDGTLGMNFDHTYGDGMTWNRMVREVFEDMKGIKSKLKPLPAPSTSFEGSQHLLSWNLSAESKAHIRQARVDARSLKDDVDTYCLKFKDFGRERIKAMKISPDAAAQMAFQLAYAKVHQGKRPAVYESCAMKNYFHGRTETIRSCTTDSVAMVDTFLNGGSDDEKRAALQVASKTHINIAKGAKACSGPFQGVDRHLYAMKNLAGEMGLSHPFFEDALYSRSNTWILSTSNVTHPFVDNFGFGAVAQHGYGLGYMTLSDCLPVHITCFKSSGETSSSAMGEAIAESFHDFNKLFKE